MTLVVLCTPVAECGECSSALGAVRVGGAVGTDEGFIWSVSVNYFFGIK